MKAIINTKLILEDSIIFDGAITFEDGVIVQMGKAAEVEIPEGAEIIDAEGLYIGPGFVDIHTHSDGKVFFQDEPQIACDSSCEMAAFGQCIQCRYRQDCKEDCPISRDGR